MIWSRVSTGEMEFIPWLNGFPKRMRPNAKLDHRSGRPRCHSPFERCIGLPREAEKALTFTPVRESTGES